MARDAGGRRGAGRARCRAPDGGSAGQRGRGAVGVNARQGETVTITTTQGVPGLAGPVTFRDRMAMVAVFAAAALGADVVVAGPPAEVMGADVGAMPRSIRFAGAGA